MNGMFVMRRANGELFSEEIGGTRRVPLWSSEDSVARFKERNPELIIFNPTRFTRALFESFKKRTGSDHAPELFLLSEDAPDADLESGRPITLEEVFPGN
jgi:hypothetical protein